MLAPSSYSKPVISQVDIIIAYNSCDILKSYTVTEMKFTSEVTCKTYFRKGDLSLQQQKCNIFLTFDECKDGYIGSAVDFKPHFRIKKK